MLLTKDSIASAKQAAAKQVEYLDWCEAKFGNLELADDASVDLTAAMPWFSVYNRDDLKTLLTIAPIWRKDPNGRGIAYTAAVDNYTMRIQAYDAALPSTCKVVKEEVVIPAQAERVEIREKLVCNLG